MVCTAAIGLDVAQIGRFKPDHPSPAKRSRFYETHDILQGKVMNNGIHRGARSAGAYTQSITLTRGRRRSWRSLRSFGDVEMAQEQDQKIAACGSSYQTKNNALFLL
jgi:hypothetical protein